MSFHMLRQDSLVSFHPGLLAMPPDLCPWRQSGRTGSEMIASQPGSEIDPIQKKHDLQDMICFWTNPVASTSQLHRGRPR